MTPTRRSMGDALQTASLPPEAMALIREGTPKPRATLEVVREAPGARAQAPAAETELAPETKPVKPEAAAEPAEPKRRPERGRAKSPAEIPAEAPEGVTGMVPVTFRLPAHIPGALVRASADRKIRRLRPYTQQEIVAEALSEWLEKAGFLG